MAELEEQLDLAKHDAGKFNEQVNVLQTQIKEKDQVSLFVN